MGPMTFTTLIHILLLAAIASVNVKASPIGSQSRVVYNPRITSPTAAITWLTGSTHNITWDASNIPAQEQRSTGHILLGHYDGNSENLDINHPLASGFPIKAGRQLVTIPKNLQPRNDYIVVLFGDSGNASPKFKIVRA